MHAAKGGLTEANCYIGLSYENGDGVAVDKHEAFKWILCTAEAGIAIPIP